MARRITDPLPSQGDLFRAPGKTRINFMDWVFAATIASVVLSADWWAWRTPFSEALFKLCFPAGYILIFMLIMLSNAFFVFIYDINGSRLSFFRKKYVATDYAITMTPCYPLICLIAYAIFR